MVARLGLGGWDVADRLEETPVVEPVHPLEGGELDGFERLPGPEPSDHLGLEQANDALGQRVVVGITDAADGGLDARDRQALGVPDAEILAPAVAVVYQATVLNRPAVVQRLLQGIEDKPRPRIARHPPADDA